MRLCMLASTVTRSCTAADVQLKGVGKADECEAGQSKKQMDSLSIEDFREFVGAVMTLSERAKQA